MIKNFGRWLFGIQVVRKSALCSLYLFPGVRRWLRIYVGVEGGMNLGLYASNPTPAELAARPAAILADLRRGGKEVAQ